MDRLTEMEAFASVVDLGGFTDAARKLGLSKSAISKHVSSLEARLGARLLNRTTRRVSPTEIGLAYYDKARQVLDNASEADAMVTSMQSEPKGSLRLSANADFGVNHISKALGQFLNRYPEINVNMVLGNRNVDLLSEGFDLAIRIGDMEDSTLRTRKLAETNMRIIGSPSYFQENGTPMRIDDLSQHKLLHFSNQSSGNVWKLTAPSGEKRMIRAGGSLTVNDGQSLLQAAEDGLGIAYLPSYLYHEAVEEGRLMIVMPDLPIDTLGIHLVYPPGLYTQPKLRAFIDFLVEHFKSKGPEHW